MQTFTPYEYMLIDVANNFGKDDLVYQDRINWTRSNMSQLEELAWSKEWKQRPQYLKSVMALRDIQAGKRTGHLIHFDSVCSGIQIMSVLTKCIRGCMNTGAVNLPDNSRPSAYRAVLKSMVTELDTNLEIDYADIKQAVMTSVYGSLAEPVKLFGYGTDQLIAFYKAVQEVAPGAFNLIDVLRDTWQSYALSHSWTMPDNHFIDIKVMQTVQQTITLDEPTNMNERLEFVHRYQINAGSYNGVSNIANIIHSIDGYILRSLVRHCSYDSAKLNQLSLELEAELLSRAVKFSKQGKLPKPLKPILNKYIDTNIIDIACIDKLLKFGIKGLPTKYLQKLSLRIEEILEYPSFEMLTIHDSFACSPVNMNRLRYWYNHILADLSESRVLDDIINNITGRYCNVPKMTAINFSSDIRNADYSLC